MKIAITIPDMNQLGGVSSYYKSIFPHIQKNKRVRIVAFHMGSGVNKGGFLHPVADQIRFRKFIKKENPDLIHVNPSLNFKSFIRDGIFILQSKHRKKPVLVFFRGWKTSFEKKVRILLKWFFNLTYLKSNCFIVLSSEFKSRLREWGIKSNIILGTTAVDIRLLRNFSLSHKTSSLKKKNAFKILFLSRIEKQKGIYETIDAFDRLLKKGYDLSLSIAGDGDDIYGVKEYLKHKDIPEDRLVFMGVVSGNEKIKSFMEHDIYCFPSHSEGMPNSVLEAMAFGLPVITCPVGGLKDFFQHGKMGFLTEIGNSEQLAQSIEKLVCNKKLIGEIMAFNHGYARKHFLSPGVAKKLIQTYMSLSSGLK